MKPAVEVRFREVQIGKLRRALRDFLPYLGRNWKLMVAALACGLGAVAMHLLRPWPLKLVFDAVLLPAGAAPDPWVAAAGRLPADLLLAGICLALLLVSLLWGVLSYGQAYLTARAGQSVVYDLRYDAHAHLQRLSLSFHQRQQKGDLLMRLTGDINVLRDLLVDSLILGVSSSLLLVAMLAILLWMDWRLSLVVLALLPVLALTTFRFSSRIRSAARQQRKREGRIAAAVSETLHGVRVIQAFGQERIQDKRFQRSNRRGLKAGLRTTRLEASMSRVVEVLLAAGTAAVFWYGVRRVQAGVLSPGDLLVFISYVHSSFKPLRRLARASSRMAKATVCAGRLRELLREPPAVRSGAGAKRARKSAGRVEFRRISFSYPGKGRVLHRVSFRVEPGAFAGIVGPSGSGKSTLFALLLRLHDPTRGRIRLDGRDLRRYTLESLRAQMSVVLQDPFLFGDTIRNNIAFGRPGATEREVSRAAHLAQVTEFAGRLPGGLETSLAEAGASLSAGQRQRIAIARAFLRESPVLLLDEPTSGLDAVSEAKVLSALDRLRRGRTTLMVAHRLSAVQSADEILVLRGGKVVERGSHGDLLAAGGWYARTWRSQAEEYPSSRVLPFAGKGLRPSGTGVRR